MTRTAKILLAAATALAVHPADATAAPACAGVDVVVPGPVIGWGTCVPTPLPGQVCRHPFVTGTGVDVYGEVCVPTP
jgi:hypothetical protein